MLILFPQIGRDVDRTFPQHEMFYHDGGPGQESLRRLLTWYAALDPEVGYCQGMGFIAALLLSYMIEEDAFYCLYAVLTVRTVCLMMTCFVLSWECECGVGMPPSFCIAYQNAPYFCSFHLHKAFSISVFTEAFCSAAPFILASDGRDAKGTFCIRRTGREIPP